jgi:diacylglycerol kinase family enzyme
MRTSSESASSAQTTWPSEARPVRSRVFACVCLGCVLAALVLLISAGASAIGVVVTAAAAVVITVLGVWWFASRRGVLHRLGAALALLAPLGLLAWYAYRGVLWVVIAVLALLIAAAACARVASRYAPRNVPSLPPPSAATPAQHPFLIMNPRSGGGKVERFHLAEGAADLGAEVALLDGPEYQDVAELARHAVDRQADLLGVAGGDGTQALVAAVAAQHGLPFLVLSAGTRNHFALDLGLDRDDPAAGLAALRDGVDLCIDLGEINGRTFVNNASFGAYAEIVEHPGYRDDKRGTTLDALPALLTHQQGPRLVVRVDDASTIEAPTALLVSNNPYGMSDVAGLGRRYHMDQGELGVISVTVDSAAHAARLLTGTRSKGLRAFTAREIVVDAEADEIPVGIDGEAVRLRTPVVCRIRPRALRVRVPIDRPGPLPDPPSMHPSAVIRLALGRPA